MLFFEVFDEVKTYISIDCFESPKARKPRRPQQSPHERANPGQSLERVRPSHQRSWTNPSLRQRWSTRSEIYVVGRDELCSAYFWGKGSLKFACSIWANKRCSSSQHMLTVAVHFSCVLRRGPRCYFRCECFTGGESVAGPRVNRFLALSH